MERNQERLVALDRALQRTHGQRVVMVRLSAVSHRLLQDATIARGDLEWSQQKELLSRLLAGEEDRLRAALSISHPAPSPPIGPSLVPDLLRT